MIELSNNLKTRVAIRENVRTTAVTTATTTKLLLWVLSCWKKVKQTKTCNQAFSHTVCSNFIQNMVTLNHKNYGSLGKIVCKKILLSLLIRAQALCMISSNLFQDIKDNITTLLHHRTSNFWVSRIGTNTFMLFSKIFV